MNKTGAQAESQVTRADYFSAIFRAEHREVRDLILDLVQAYQKNETSRIPTLLGELARCAGPHFRYEEEVLYPQLVKFFGPQYVHDLYHAHDRAIATAKELVAMAEKSTLTPEEAEFGIRGVRAMLPHVTDCDGLSILVERMPEPEVRKILAAREKARNAGLDLLTWAAEVRRPHLKNDGNAKAPAA